jgi:hypothetical protein
MQKFMYLKKVIAFRIVAFDLSNKKRFVRLTPNRMNIGLYLTVELLIQRCTYYSIKKNRRVFRKPFFRMF